MWFFFFFFPGTVCRDVCPRQLCSAPPGSPSVAALLAAFPGPAGLSGAICTAALGPTIFWSILCIFQYIYIFFRLLYFCAGSAAAGSCPGMLTAPRFLLPPSINYSRPDATPHRDRPSLSFSGCVSPQDPLFLPPLHSPDLSSLFFTRFGLLDGFFSVSRGFFEQPELCSTLGSVFGVGGAWRDLCTRAGQKGGFGWEGGVTPYSYLELGKLCKCGSK